MAQGARAAELLDHALAIVGGDALEPRGAVEDLAGQAEDATQALVGVGQAAVVGDGEDADRRRDGQRPEALLALGQRPLGGAALADVGHLGEEVQGRAVGIAHDGHVERDPRLAAVDAQIALLGAVGRQLAGRERAHRLAVALVMGGVGDVAHADPGELSRLVAQHRRQRAVDAHEAPVGAGDRHPDAGVLEGALEALLGVAQRRGLLVGADAHAGLTIDAGAPQAPAPAGLGRAEAQRELGPVGLAGHELMPGGSGAGEVLGVDHVARRAPDEVLDGDADAPLERAVAVKDDPVEIRDDRDVRRQLEDPRGAEALQQGRVGALWAGHICLEVIEPARGADDVAAPPRAAAATRWDRAAPRDLTEVAEGGEHGLHHLRLVREGDLLEVLGVGHRHVGARDAPDGRVEVVEGLLLHERGEVGADAAVRPALLDDHAAVGLAHRGEDRVEVERAQGARVDDLGLDAVLLGEHLGGLLGRGGHARDADDGHVGALAADGGLAEVDEVLVVLGDLAALAVEVLVLDEDDRVVVADGRLEQALGVGRRRGHGDQQAGHVQEEGLEAVRVRRARAGGRRPGACARRAGR